MRLYHGFAIFLASVDDAGCGRLSWDEFTTKRRTDDCIGGAGSFSWSDTFLKMSIPICYFPSLSHATYTLRKLQNAQYSFYCMIASAHALQQTFSCQLNLLHRLAVLVAALASTHGDSTAQLHFVFGAIPSAGTVMREVHAREGSGTQVLVTMGCELT